MEMQPRTPDAPGAMLRAPTQQEAPGRVGPIGVEEISMAMQDFELYKKGKADLDARVKANEEWYKLRHWDIVRKAEPNAGDPEPASAWLLNSIANKHADAMDNYPEPSVLPREEDDVPDAKILSGILPVVLEQNGYEQVYSDMWWYKLKTGTGVQGVFWDSSANNGLGDVAVKHIDLLNIFWEPGVKDIQKSRNIFTIEAVDRDILEKRYSFLAGKLSGTAIDIPQYTSNSQLDTTKKVVVVDWYYKVADGTRQILHYCKFVGRELIYASENDEQYRQSGYYIHGEYPFVFDTLFQTEGDPAGFGYIDVCKDAQMYIDKMGQAILKNALFNAKPRYFVKADGGVNESEFADPTKDFVHTSGARLGEEDIRPIVTSTLNPLYVQIMNAKIDELKETSGNRDVNSGGSQNGVTAASAIAAMQEAGSKLSRDMIKSSYRAYTKVNYYVLENIRQFYTEPRSFRIVGERGAMKYVQFNSRRMQQRPQGDMGMDMGYRMPIFDIKVRAHRENPFSRIAQNELALSFFGRGFFNPQLSDQALACIEMMDFEGKDQTTQRIAENGTLYQQLQQMMGQMLKLGQIVEADHPEYAGFTQSMAQQLGASAQQPMISTGGDVPTSTNTLGDVRQTSKNNTTTKAKDSAQAVAAPAK
ncbi:MAG: hypothetical protein WC047_00010 [Kiritimatiellales bacterium]